MAERSIVDILKAQDSLLTELDKILKEEFALLKERKALDLTELNNRKSKCLLDLQTNDQSLKLHSQKDRLKNDLSKIKNLLADKLKSCQHQNDINGRLIELNLAANRRLASALIEIRDTSTMTYDDKGNKNAIRGRHLNIDA